MKLRQARKILADPRREFRAWRWWSATRAPRDWQTAEHRVAVWWNRHPELLRQVIEVPREVRHWGQIYTVTPRLITERFGDGMQLIGLSPMNQRPEFYVARVPGGVDSNGDVFRGFLDDIYEAVEDQFGTGWCEECEESVRDCQCGNATCEFPEPSWDSGCTWFEMDWPKVKARSAERKVRDE